MLRTEQNQTMNTFTRLAACFFVLAFPAAQAGDASEFRSAWPKEGQRVWAGPQYWTNPLQDWRVADGRLECLVSGDNRNVHLLTRELGEKPGDFRTSVRLGRLEPADRPLSNGWVGFRIGAKGKWHDYRDSAIRGLGLEAGMTTSGELFIGKKASAAALVPRGISRTKWKVTFVDTHEPGVGDPARAIDGDPNTYWHTQYRKKRTPYPHEMQIDMGKPADVAGFCYLPRQKQTIGRIKGYEFFVSEDGKEWGQPVSSGEFENTASIHVVRCKEKRGRFVRLVAKSDFMKRPAAVIAELYVLDKASLDKAEATPKQGPDPGARKLLAAAALPAGIQLRVAAEPAGEGYKLRLAAHDAMSGELLSEVSRSDVVPEQLVGNLALVCDYDPPRRVDVSRGKAQRRRRRGRGRASNVRFWFADWRVSGSKIEAHTERAFGPILFAQHTLSRNVLKMAAQMAPVGENEAQAVRLQIRDVQGRAWRTVGEEKIDPLARIATFRVASWDAKRDIPYRLAYVLAGANGAPKEHYWHGTVRRDPVAKDTLVVAAFTGNADPAFPNNELVEHVAVHKPDVLFFSGDNIYENVGGYGAQRGPLETAGLDYVRKWYLVGWVWGEMMRDTPSITIPDDHDVYQGNLWGQGGRKAPKGQNSGGYTMPAEWVNVVQRTQTSHLPDPFDPTPVEQGISVYYTSMTYGRISFAILEDRKFKTGPAGVVAKTKGRSDWVDGKDFDPRVADVSGAKLLGDRQLRFLRNWAADWRGVDMKAALSQTVFANVATLHGGGAKRLVADYDSNGWPQTGRSKALHELRRGFAFMIGGDQHLATIVHHGIDTWGDAGWSFCVPSIANFYVRRWAPLEPGKNRRPGAPEYTGEFRDGFGNPITVHAAANPNGPTGKEPAWLHDKMPGYGIVRFNRPARTITMECWPIYADPRDPKTGGQYPGWPKTINQHDNYARRAAAHLPAIEVAGLAAPVLQVIDESNGEVVYTLRVRETPFRPKVFTAGTYTVRVGEPDTGEMKTLKGLRAGPASGKHTVRVQF